MKSKVPRCIIIAGPNGAGKTTFAREFLPREAGIVHFVNADLIAAETGTGSTRRRAPAPERTRPAGCGARGFRL